jgi:hypothetical protein
MIRRTTTILLVAACLTGGLFTGGCANCCVKPEPGAAAVVLDVKAKPKAGTKAEHFTRVPVYDAAPRAAKPTGEYEHVDYDALGDIVVWLEPASGTGEAAATEAAPIPSPSAPRKAMEVKVSAGRQADRIYAAHVGQPVVLFNAGDQAVSLYSVSDGNDFELAPLPPGYAATIESKTEGLIEVLADPSQPPVATIYAAPTKYAARARSGKTVVFKDVPPGAYQAVAWHPRLPGSTANVGEVAAGQVKRATLQLGVNDLPKVE